MLFRSVEGGAQAVEVEELRRGQAAGERDDLGSIDEGEQRWREAVEAGYEIARTAPAYMSTRDELDDYAVAAEQMDLAVRNVRVLARAVVRATELDDEVPDSIFEALAELSVAVSLIGDELADSDRGSEARAHVLTAAADATEALEENPGLSTSMIVGQIRSTAVDLLRGLGEEGPAARAAVRSAAPAHA